MNQNIAQFVGDLDSGDFETRLAIAIKTACAGTIRTGKVSSVNIDLSFSQVAHSRQLLVKHKLAFVEPTDTGKVSEESTKSTPMHYNADGTVTLMPDSQTDFFKDRSRQESPID